MQKLLSTLPYEKNTLGMEKRQTYEDLVKYIGGGSDKIRYPNRDAKIIRNSFEMSQLDGIGALQMHQFDEKMHLRQERDQLLFEFAKHHNLPLADVIAYTGMMGLQPFKADREPERYDIFSDEDDDAMSIGSFKSARQDYEAGVAPLPKFMSQEVPPKAAGSKEPAISDMEVEMKPLGRSKQQTRALIIPSAGSMPERTASLPPSRAAPQLRNDIIRGQSVAAAMRRLRGDTQEHEIGLGTQSTPVHFYQGQGRKLSVEALPGPQQQQMIDEAAWRAVYQMNANERAQTERAQRINLEVKDLLKGTTRDWEGSRAEYEQMRRGRPRRRSSRTQNLFSSAIAPPRSVLEGTTVVGGSSGSGLVRATTPTRRTGSPVPQPSPVIRQLMKKVKKDEE